MKKTTIYFALLVLALAYGGVPVKAQDAPRPGQNQSEWNRNVPSRQRNDSAHRQASPASQSRPDSSRQIDRRTPAPSPKPAPAPKPAPPVFRGQPAAPAPAPAPVPPPAPKKRSFISVVLPFLNLGIGL